MASIAKARSSINWEALIAALLLMLVVGPYFVWTIKYNNTLMLFARLLFAFLCINNSRIRKQDRGLVIIFSFVVVYYIAVAIFHGNINLNGIISGSTLLLYSFIFFTNIPFAKKVFNYFSLIFSLFLLVSLLIWSLAIMGILSPIGSITVGDKYYTIYPMLVVEPGYVFYRFYGPFDEPGVVGTIGACILCTKKLSFKDWQVWVVLIAGILSFSLFFYVLIGVYLVAYTVFIKRSILLTLLLLGSFALFYYGTKDNDIMYQLMWRRLEWDSDNQKFQGDTRVNEDVDLYYNRIKGTSDYYFGIDDIKGFWNDVGESASYKIVIITNGLIFFILYLSFFILYAWKNKTSMSNFLLFCFVLIGNTYQRPGIYSMIMLFLYSVLARRDMLLIDEST